MFLIRILILLAFTSSAAAATPSAVSITYNLFRNGTHIGVITEHFEVKDGVYRANSEAKAIGLFALAQRRPVTYSSTGESTRDGLRPARFQGSRSEVTVSAAFDWKSDTLTLIHDGLNQTMALPRAAQDRLSLMYQLMHLVRNNARTIEFAMTNGRKLDHYRYSITPDILIDTPLKRVNTLHLVKQREKDDTQTEIWLAPEFHHLPVKVLIVEDDGVRYEQVVTRLDIKP